MEIPVHHTGVFGQTGVGKTKLLKIMISQAVQQGYRVLIFDSKVTGAEFEGIGTDVGFYIDESTDPDIFRSLLEGMRTRGRGNMERYRGGFIEICDGTDSFEEIGERLKAKLSDSKIRGATRAMYHEIQFDYGRLMKFLVEQKFPGTLPDLRPLQIARVPTYRLPNLALQGLVVRSMVERYLHAGPHKLIIVVDEAPNFVNQKRFNPAKDALQELDAQGRSTEKFGWYSGQTITGFDKANMKNLWYWVMGREMEKNEAKDVFDTQTSKALSIDEIKRMKVREFIVSTPDGATVVMVPKVDEKTTERKEVALLPSVFGTYEERSQSSGESEVETTKAFAEPKSGGHTEERARPSPSPLDTPKSTTKTLAAFDLEVTRLESESFIGKVVFILNRLGKPAYPKEIGEHFAEYGWPWSPTNFSTNIKPHVASGLVFREENGMYRLPKQVSVKEVLR
ncbi:MAG: DUF87 domain-containing protein [Thaumarchaeota archaeon]|nr:DUF87 domain-containing protein [Nitrososphaerota archaeon]